MKKYSYHIVAIEWQNYKVINGSGFFVKKGNRLFFVTSSHCLTGWNVFNGVASDEYPDVIEIILFNRATNKLDVFPINAIPFKNANKGNRIHNSNDLTVIEVDPALQTTHIIYGIEDYLYPTVNYHNSEIFLAGYDNNYPAGISLISILEANCKDGVLLFANNSLANNDLYEAQTIRGEVVRGASGAPAFVYDNNTMKFCGVCIGGDNIPGKFPLLIMVKPEVVLEMIDELLKSKSYITNSQPSILKLRLSNNFY